ncbi:MAG: GDSL-type esterase/lipase family protein [Oscillospiraceae bacterium]
MSKPEHWASVWGNAISIAENRPEGYNKNLTMRYPVYTQFGGSAMRLTFDNYCGTEPVTLTKTTALINGVFYPVTFGSRREVTMPAGGCVVSDELECDIQPQSLITISFYFEDFTLLRSAVYTSGPLTEGYYAIGDLTEAEQLPQDNSRGISIIYFLSNISVLTSEENRTVVCYGDSITAQDWPEYLTLRCNREEKLNTAVIRRAASGTRMLREYSCITYESYGLMGSKRFDHEVPTDGADTVIIQHGINDIIHPVGTMVNPFRPMSDMPTVEELIDCMKFYIAKSREYGYRVYIGTLLPIEGWRTYAPFREEVRRAFNDWIRATALIDGCIDFDAALRDPERPTRFLPEYDSGDHLHPSKAGYKRMADIVPEEILK